jgi:hypothetical protein
VGSYISMKFWQTLKSQLIELNLFQSYSPQISNFSSYSLAICMSPCNLGYINKYVFNSCKWKLFTHFFYNFCLGKSGYVKSRYCIHPAKFCFGSGQVVHVPFNPPFQRAPKVMIGLTLHGWHSQRSKCPRSCFGGKCNQYWIQNQILSMGCIYHVSTWCQLDGMSMNVNMLIHPLSG